MKRKAVLIGNANGLTGVTKDLERIKSFLLSNMGGAWNNNEIVVLPYSTKEKVDNAVNSIKDGGIDFSIVYFSGHGGYKRETVLQLSDYSTISENNLIGLSSRQITIFDCCRSISHERKDVELSATFESFSDNQRDWYREIYDKRIIQAIPQQVRLYSCAVGEISNDTSNGGVYTNALMQAAKQYSTVGQIHNFASNLVERDWNNGKIKTEQQHPDAVLPKCLIEQQLIFSLASELKVVW